MKKLTELFPKAKLNFAPILYLGAALAVAMSWSAHQSIKWAIVHGILGWTYVGYYWYYLPI